MKFLPSLCPDCSPAWTCWRQRGWYPCLRPVYSSCLCGGWLVMIESVLVYLVRWSCKQAEGVSGHILTLFRLPCLLLIVQQILSNLINTECSRPICAVTCWALCFHQMLHKGHQFSPMTSTLKHIEIVSKTMWCWWCRNKSHHLYWTPVDLAIVSCQLDCQKPSCSNTPYTALIKYLISVYD